jgi:hypothetical protein
VSNGAVSNGAVLNGTVLNGAVLNVLYWMALYWMVLHRMALYLPANENASFPSLHSLQFYRKMCTCRMWWTLCTFVKFSWFCRWWIGDYFSSCVSVKLVPMFWRNMLHHLTVFASP